MNNWWQAGIFAFIIVLICWLKRATRITGVVISADIDNSPVTIWNRLGLANARWSTYKAELSDGSVMTLLSERCRELKVDQRYTFLVDWIYEDGKIGFFEHVK